MVDQSDPTPMDTDTSADETIGYKKVIYKKLEGIVVLTDSNLIFESERKLGFKNWHRLILLKVVDDHLGLTMEVVLCMVLTFYR